MHRPIPIGLNFSRTFFFFLWNQHSGDGPYSFKALCRSKKIGYRKVEEGVVFVDIWFPCLGIGDYLNVCHITDRYIYLNVCSLPAIWLTTVTAKLNRSHDNRIPICRHEFFQILRPYLGMNRFLTRILFQNKGWIQLNGQTKIFFQMLLKC